MKRPLMLFDSDEAPSSFVHDLRALLSLDDAQRNKLASMIVDLDLVFSLKDDQDFSEVISPASLGRDAYDVTRFLLTKIAIADASIAEIQADLEALGYAAHEQRALTGYLEGLCQRLPDLSLRAQKAVAEGSTIDTLEAVGFSVEARAVHLSGTLVDVVPIVVARFGLRGASDRHERVFQLSEHKLGQLIDMLQDEQRKLLELKNRVKLTQG